MKICGHNANVGDYVVVEYTTGKKFKGCIIKGIVIKLWPEKRSANILQGQLNSGRRFHDYDKILLRLDQYR